MPAKAGIQFLAKGLGPRFRGDERKTILTGSEEALERVEIELNRMGFPRGAKRDSS